MLDKFPLPQLPPHLHEKAGQAWATVRRVAGPLAASIGSGMNKALSGGRMPTLGNTFRHLLVVGLNKSELLLDGEQTPVTSENWQDLADENLRRGLGLVFFAPRGYDGNPVNPYLFLAGDLPNELAPKSPEAADEALPLAEQLLAGMGLVDLCRLPPSAPNTINMLIAADVLFHWDVKDNYILPTSTISWVRDVEQVLKGYPRTTKAVLYTTWDRDVLPPTERIKVMKLRDMPVAEDTWLNKPTIQEKYGTHVLALALMVASAVGIGLHMQQNGIDDINEELRMVEQQIPREGKYVELIRAVNDVEKQTGKREIMYLAVKDTARAIGLAGMKFSTFEVKVPDPDEAPKNYVVTIEAEKDAYKGWLQEEPIAKDVLMNSALMNAVRKPPANSYKLEALVPVEPAWRSYKKLNKPLASTAAPVGAAARPDVAAPASDAGASEEVTP